MGGPVASYSKIKTTCGIVSHCCLAKSFLCTSLFVVISSLLPVFFRVFLFFFRCPPGCNSAHLRAQGSPLPLPQGGRVDGAVFLFGGHNAIRRPPASLPGKLLPTTPATTITERALSEDMLVVVVAEIPGKLALIHDHRHHPHRRRCCCCCFHAPDVCRVCVVV